METIVLQPKTKKEAALIKELVSALKIPYIKEERENIYDANFVKKILDGDKHKKLGKYETIKTADLWK